MKDRGLKALWGAGGVRLLAGDLLLVLTISAAAWGLLSLSGSAGAAPSFADIEVSGQRDARLAVAVDTVREVPGPLGMTSIEVRDGRIRVLSSPCSLKLCVKAGWIDRAGEMIVCLPNEVVIRLPGDLPGGIDALSQ
jgi:hypothetical protein